METRLYCKMVKIRVSGLSFRADSLFSELSNHGCPHFLFNDPLFSEGHSSFYGKSVKENKKGYAVLGVLIAFLLHGLYDFSLSEEFSTFADVSAAIALTLAVFELVIIIILVFFIRKDKENPKYTEPLDQYKSI